MRSVLVLLSFGITAAVAAYIDRSTAAKERREKFIQTFDNLVELENIREGIQTLQDQQNHRRSQPIPADIQEFAQQRQQIRQTLNQNSTSTLPLSIPTNNEGLEEFLYQSDILLTPNQINQMTGGSRKKRQAAIGTFQKWDKTKPIYYKFDSSISAASADIFRLGAMFWTNNTCLNIVESSATPNIRVFYGQGCYSYVGYLGFSSQDLSIGYNCGQFGVVTHELAHALGFFHEQSRHDRDSYITVDTTNMDTFYLNNWRKESTATNDNYWGSGMHYGDSPSMSGPIFAIASDAIYQSTMGSYTQPSFKDIYGMNIHYNCMCATGAICQNGGFRHPRDCNLCICPSGFGDANCGGLQPAEHGAANIGAVLVAESFYKPLTAKTGDPTKILPRAQAIHWHITAPADKKIEIIIQSVAGQCNVGCPWGSLDVKVKNFDLVGSRFCCASDIAANPKLVSIENFAIISLYSQAYEHAFSLQYRYIDSTTSNATTTTPTILTTTTPTSTSTTTTTTTPATTTTTPTTTSTSTTSTTTSTSTTPTTTSTSTTIQTTTSTTPSTTSTTTLLPATTTTPFSLTSTTESPSTTSSVQCCPTNGVWTDWQQTTTCGDTCGSCAAVTKRRTCASAEYGCPCVGNATKTETCGISPCKFPRNSCCGTYKAMVYKGKLMCGPLPQDNDTSLPSPTCCAADGTWSAWGTWSACTGTCGQCGSTTRNRTCLSADSGCPCIGDITESKGCLVKGLWSDWVVQSQCNGTCGGCGTMIFNRTCLSNDCSCEGSTTRTEQCSFSPCVYPKDTCCNGLKAGSYSGQLLCGPLPEYTENNPLENCTR